MPFQTTIHNRSHFTMNTNIIPFHGHDLVTVERDGKIYAAVKPICEAIGLDWVSQHKRLRRDPVLSTCMVIMTIRLPGDPRTREVVFLPLSKLNGWLFGIDASRVKPELRAAVVDYQFNCYDLLYDHYHGRAARRSEKYWFEKYPHWPGIRPLALQGLKNIEIAQRLDMSAGRVARAIKRMIQVGLLDPAVRIAARYQPATAQRLLQLPLCLSWGV